MKEIDEKYFVKDKSQETKTFEQTLDKDENILYKGRPKKFAYVLEKTISFAPIAILWAIIDISAVIGILSTQETPSFVLLFIIPFFALHLFPFWIWIGSILKSSKEINNTKYYITNKRLVCVKGKIPYVDSSIKIEDLKESVLKRSFTDKKLKVGDIYLTSENCSFVMFDIYDSEFISEKINNLINKINSEKTFYEDAIVCDHCGSTCKQNLRKCPNCGAPFEVK